MQERRSDGSPTVAIDQLCSALVADTPGLATAFVDRLLACGVSIDALYESYIPRAAARLGDLWLEDRLSFTAVTLGMARLTEVFRGLSPIFMKARRPASRGRRALFALVPGEEHALGVVLAADHFQRAGWSVHVELQPHHAGLEELVSSQPFDLIGLSAGSRRSERSLERAVTRLRESARPGTRIAIGGALVRLDPGIVERLGADIDGTSVREALYELDSSD